MRRESQSTSCAIYFIRILNIYRSFIFHSSNVTFYSNTTLIFEACIKAPFLLDSSRFTDGVSSCSVLFLSSLVFFLNFSRQTRWCHLHLDRLKVAECLGMVKQFLSLTILVVEQWLSWFCVKVQIEFKSIPFSNDIWNHLQ